MQQTNSIQEKFITFLKLFLPMVVTQISLFATTFVSIFLTGQYSTVDLAGVSIGYNIWVSIFTGLLGLLLGITPLIAQRLGAKRTEDIPIIIQHALYLGLALSALLIVVGLFGLKPFLSLMSLEPAVFNITVHYMVGVAISMPPILAVCVLRNAVDSHGFVHYSTTIMIVSFIVNFIANKVLIFGYGPIEALGGVGTGYALSISSWFNFFAFLLIFLVKEPFKGYRIFTKSYGFDMFYWRELLTIGFPIGIALFCEISIFSIAAFLMTEYGTAIIAAHQAAISLTNIFYCVPLSISMSATIAVAYEVGAKRYDHAKTYAHMVRVFALCLAACISSFGFLHLRELAAIYTHEESMIDLISKFLSYALFFSIIDAFGTPLQGILRAYKDVKMISYIAIGSYWGVCLPVALLAAHTFNQGPYGIWIGLLTSLVVAGILYTLRVYHVQKHVFVIDNK